MDYALAQMQGRCTCDPVFSNIDNPDKTSKAVLDIAVNFFTGKYYKGGDRDGQKKFRTLYRRIVCWGPNADYVFSCNEEDSVIGRLLNVVGRADDEVYGERERREVLRADIITIMDRKKGD